MQTLVVNFFAGPGTGKSSMAAGLFSELKWRNINCEMALEFAKDKVWEGSISVLHDQIYIFGKQLHRLRRLDGKVNVAITDSPLLLSLIYGRHEPEEFKRLVWKVYDEYWNFNVFLKRHKPFHPAGRLQDEREARQLDEKIKRLLQLGNVPFLEIDTGRESIVELANKVTDILGLAT